MRLRTYHHSIEWSSVRLASKDTYYTFKIRTNYGKFNIRFSGAKVWNSIQENLKSEKRNQFKKILKKNILSTYPDAWSILLPCFALYVYVFVFVFVFFFCVFFCFVFFCSSLFLFFFLLISNCLYNVCWKLAVMFSNSNHISNLWFPFRTDHGYLTRLAPAIFGWPWSSLFCNCVNLLYTIIIFNIWGLNKAVVVVVVVVVSTSSSETIIFSVFSNCFSVKKRLNAELLQQVSSSEVINALNIRIIILVYYMYL